MTQTEALRLALEALKTIDEAMPFPVAKLAIKECKAALEANEFNPDWDTQAVLAEEIQRMAKRIEDLEAMLERQTARIVELQTHIENFDGEDK